MTSTDPADSKAAPLDATSVGTPAQATGGEVSATSASGRPPAPTWGLAPAFAGIGLAFVGAITFSSLYASAAGIEPGAATTLGQVLASLGGIWAGFLGTAVWVSKRRGSGSLVDDFGLRFVLPRDAVKGVALGLFCQFFVIRLVYLPLELLAPERLDGLSEPAEALTGLGQGLGLLPLAIGICVVAPFVEELFFRGLVLPAFGRYLRPPFAVVASALLFGVAHFQPLQSLGLTAFGVFLALSALRCRRLGEAVFAHAAFNATTVMSLLLL